MNVSSLDAVLSTVGWGLIIFSYLVWGVTGCGSDKKDSGHGGWKSLGWLCAVAGFILQIIAIWIY